MINKSKVVALSTAQVLTHALAVLGTGSPSSAGTFDVRNNRQVTFEVTYAKGDETSTTLVVEGTLDSGAAGVWLPAEPASDVSGSLAAGVFSTPQGYRKRSLDTTGTYPVTVECGGFHMLRVKAIGTAGTPTGTVALRVAGVQES